MNIKPVFAGLLRHSSYGYGGPASNSQLQTANVAMWYGGVADELIHLPHKVAGVCWGVKAVVANELIHLPPRWQGS